MAFRVGQKVTRKTKTLWVKDYAHEIYPEFGVIYTIREILPDDEGGALLFCEIVNRLDHYLEGFNEATFDANSFRPVVERKTDISIFTKMLTDHHVNA